MSRPLFILVFALALPFADATYANEDDAIAIGVVESYVIKEKGWPCSDFRIEKRARDNDYDVYWVIYVPDILSSDLHPPGTTKSFFAIYDFRARRVVKERYLSYPVISN